jgi:hypothetical protein
LLLVRAAEALVEVRVRDPCGYDPSNFHLLTLNTDRRAEPKLQCVLRLKALSTECEGGIFSLREERQGWWVSALVVTEVNIITQGMK